MSARQGIVWILGAGFSKFLGAPLLNQLLTHESLKRAQAIYSEGSASTALARGEEVTKLFAWGAQNKRYWEHAEEFLERLDYAVSDEVQRRAFGAVLEAFRLENSQPVDVPIPGTSYSVPTAVPDMSAFESERIGDLHEQALRLAAAEVSAFLEGSDPKLERWAPYRAWAQSLAEHDTILTFNYDLVLETLNAVVSPRIMIPTGTMLARGGPVGPKALKLHGSVNWYLEGGDETDPGAIKQSSNAALIVKQIARVGMATPGPRKSKLIEGAFADLWVGAERAISKAEAVVFCGYRLPPTDAGTKQRLVTWLRQWLNGGPSNVEDKLPVHIVLGPDPQHADPQRLKGLMRSVSPRLVPRIWPLGAEDFLGLFPRNELLRERQDLAEWVR